MENLAERSAAFESAHPQEILQWAAAAYRGKLAVVTSFQITGIVTLHMLSKISPETPVLTLDTGLLFPETLRLITELESRLSIQITRITPELTVEAQNETYGIGLWEHEPALCCYLRKVLPLQNTMHSYDAWITGLRRDQSSRRANVPIVSWDDQHQAVKITPFATWTEEMLWTYIHAYDLPYNSLHDRGYPSIGCFPCTRAVEQGEDKRAGRWSGHNKTECGIHFSTVGAD